MIVTRAEAKAKGLLFYFTGNPCPYGHVVERDTRSAGCRECRRLRSAVWRKKHPSRMRAHRAKWRSANVADAKEAGAKWRRANKSLVNEWTNARRAMKLSRTPAWADKQKIAKVYASADFQTDLTGLSHHADHELPLRGKFISGLHVHTNLRVLSGSDNSRKSNRFKPYAEHYAPDFAVATIAY